MLWQDWGARRGIFLKDRLDKFPEKNPAPTSVRPWLLSPHGLEVKKGAGVMVSPNYQKERTWDACPLSASKHGLHSWISAYLCLSAFASIHGSVPNSNFKLSKRSYLAARCFIQHTDDKNTHIGSLRIRPHFPPHGPATQYFCNYSFEISIPTCWKFRTSIFCFPYRVLKYGFAQL